MIIRQVIAGAAEPSSLQPQINALLNKGCEAVILGCTELSVIAQHETDLRLIDPIRLVVPQLLEATR